MGSPVKLAKIFQDADKENFNERSFFNSFKKNTFYGIFFEEEEIIEEENIEEEVNIEDIPF